jgi:hypothetical protein
MLNVVSGLLSGGAAPAAATSYESISTVTLGSDQTTITFSSIASTWKHLQIRYIAKANVGSNYAQSINMRFNSDTGSNYSRHFLGAYTGGYAATTAGGDATQNIINLFSGVSSTNWNASTFGAGIIDILDYQNTNKYKTVRSLAGAESNDSSTLISTLGLSSGLWQSTSAVTSISLTSNGDFKQYSSFALYGIKG